MWLLLAVLGWAGGQIVSWILVLGSAHVEGKSHDLTHYLSQADQPFWVVAPSLIGLWVGFFGAAMFASRTRGTRSLVRDVGLRFRPVDLWGIVIGVASQGLLWLAYKPLIDHRVIKNFTGPTNKLFSANHGWEFAVVAVLTACGAPFFEEILFRGVIMRALLRLFAPESLGPCTRRAWGIVAAVALDGVLFGLAHWEPVQFAGLALFGMVLAWCCYRTRRLGMGIFAHVAFNTYAVITLVVTSGVIRH